MILRKLKYLVLLLLAGVFFHSCTIEKRHYRNGFYIAGPRGNQRWPKKNHDPFTAATKNASDSIPDCAEPEGIEAPCKQNSPVAPFISDSVTARDYNPSRQAASPEKIATPVTPPDDRTSSREKPDPDKRDRPNRTELILIALAFFFVACAAFAWIAYLPFFLTVIILCCPLIGVMLFTAAMIYRQKLLRAIAAGATGEKFRVSAYYGRFKILLYLFFASVLLGLLGMVLAYSTQVGVSGILGFFGVIMFGAGIALVQLLAVILIISFLFYLFRWRKDPTGNSTKRPDRPPKDR